MKCIMFPWDDDSLARKCFVKKAKVAARQEKKFNLNYEQLETLLVPVVDVGCAGS